MEASKAGLKHKRSSSIMSSGLSKGQIKKGKVAVFACLILWNLLGTAIWSQSGNASQKKVRETSGNKASVQWLNPQEVADYIYASEVLYPEIVLRQAILETGWFKSKYLMNLNNLFGFRGNGAYLKFNSWQESVDYYVKWQKRRYTNKNEDYYRFLVRIRYARSQAYISHLKNIKLRNIKNLPERDEK